MSQVPRCQLTADYSCARILNGGWQLASGHSNTVPEKAAIDAMIRLAEAGFTSFDCADIYTGVEELIGRFLKVWGARSEIQVHTKLVPDLEALVGLDKSYVEGIVDRSLMRLGVERLDLVQFHWWNYDVPGCADMVGWLCELQAAGKIRLLGTTNFDTEHLREVILAGANIVAHQAQYSLLDRRPEEQMVELCREHGIHLLCYGGLGGGFLSERYLGLDEPPGRPWNRSLVKYRLIIEEFGGWKLFQELLEALRQIAEKHGVSLSNVAARWVLDRPRVGGVIVGAKSAEHLESNLRTFALELDNEDRTLLDRVLAKSSGPRGEPFALERVPRGRHSVIMKTDLNRLETE